MFAGRGQAAHLRACARVARRVLGSRPQRAEEHDGVAAAAAGGGNGECCRCWTSGWREQQDESFGDMISGQGLFNRAFAAV